MLFFNTKRKLIETGVLQGAVDWHSHILPGVDDGIQSMKESLDVLAYYEKIGIREVWLTPHIMEDIPNTTGELRARFDELQAAYKGSVKLHLAAENMIDNLFKTRLAARDFLPIGEKGDHLLVETSYYQPPMEFYDTLKRIQDAGYHPVLAHPERYCYMDDRDYNRLYSMQVKAQLNLVSLAGGYGKQAQEKAQTLLEKGYYTLFGSDLHHLSIFQEGLNTKALKSGMPLQLQGIPNYLVS